MLLLGHMGIGSKMIDLFRTELPKRWVLLGTVLPDLIDKPLYYVLCWATGKTGGDVGLISGTRTFGHSGLLVLALTAVGLRTGSILILAIAAGIFTHLGIDLAGDHLDLFDRSATVRAVLFPFLGFNFWAAPHRDASQHLMVHLHSSYVWSTETLGAILLSWDAIQYFRRGGPANGSALRRPETDR